MWPRSAGAFSSCVQIYRHGFKWFGVTPSVATSWRGLLDPEILAISRTADAARRLADAAKKMTDQVTGGRAPEARLLNGLPTRSRPQLTLSFFVSFFSKF